MGEENGTQKDVVLVQSHDTGLVAELLWEPRSHAGLSGHWALSLPASSVGDLPDVTNMPLAISKYAFREVTMPFPRFGDTL